ncbi:spore germination protein [Cohnella luojiensis]|uniref:Spore gernimation protein GerA n=1 Tax=Cohnella luojiensis TaxID=652876 RepID=A0A4Y8LTY3_9BACL|nr:spore germination protein [Cohnella luojiensis]TFE24293.1 spore gernimation protein GerA [Cohnella luojiensis]
MVPFLQEMKSRLGSNDDFFIQRVFLLDKPVVIMGLSTLIDVVNTKSALLEYIEQSFPSGKTVEEVIKAMSTTPHIEINEAISAITKGKLIIYFEVTKQRVIVDPIMKLLNRSIESPTNENVFQGSMSSFTEDIDTNIGIARKEFNSRRLVVKSYYTGSLQKKRLSLLYDEERVDRKLVNQVIDRIENNQDKEINHIQNLTKVMGFNSMELIPKFNTTELPQEAANSIRKGRVVLFIDRIPFALVLPSLLWDMFALENDKNLPKPIMISLRLLRVVGVLATLIMPGLYVALVSVNPEVLRIELALSIAQSRDGVPYPALIEIIMMLVVLELVIEASIRLPRSIGPTITMVGGIILGQAVVAAQLVSNLLIIILAATTIANSTVVGVQNSLSIRLFKYLIVVLASIYGVLGILGGMVLVSAYLAGLTTFGVSYLYINPAERRRDS